MENRSEAYKADEQYGAWLEEKDRDLNYRVSKQIVIPVSKQTTQTAEDDLDLPTLADFEEKEMNWLIPGYIPKGQITFLCGAGESSKTSVWVSILSSLVKGENTFFMGFDGLDERRDKNNVMFFSAEDSIQTVLKGRFRENKVTDWDYITTIDFTDSRFEKITFSSEYLEKLIEKYRPVLCVFDPLQNFIPKNVKMSERNQMRQNLRHLITYGAKYGTTFLIVVHTNKLQGAFGRNRIADSADIWDIARSILMCGVVDSKESIFYISHEKCNYGKKMQSIEFKNVKGVPVFLRYTDKSDRDYVTEVIKGKTDQKKSQSVEECMEYIKSLLQSNEGSMSAKELDEDLKLTGFSSYQRKEAKAHLRSAKEVYYEKDGFAGDWVVYTVENRKECKKPHK